MQKTGDFMKKPIQRLNSTGQAVGSMTATCTPKDSARGRLGLTTAFVKHDRVAGEALPRVVTVMDKKNIYRPAQHLNARSGLAICG